MSPASAPVPRKIAAAVWGYQELLEILADPAHPERAERIEWLGEEFDPEDFSVEIADAGSPPASGETPPGEPPA